jgi:hypothetical protein
MGLYLNNNKKLKTVYKLYKNTEFKVLKLLKKKKIKKKKKICVIK